MLKLFEAAAVILVGASFSDELEIDGAFRARVGTQTGRFNRHLLHRAEPRRDRGEETGAPALEAIRCVVDAVDGAVDGAAGHPVVMRIAAVRRRLRSRHQAREGERAAPVQRQLLERFVVHRRRDDVRRHLEHRRHALDLHLLVEGADLQFDPQIGGSRRFDLHVLVHCRVEPLEGHGHAVRTERQIGKDEPARVVRDRLLADGSELVDHLHGGAGDDGVGTVGDCAGNGAGDADLRESGRRSGQQRDQDDDERQ